MKANSVGAPPQIANSEILGFCGAKTSKQRRVVLRVVEQRLETRVAAERKIERVMPHHVNVERRGMSAYTGLRHRRAQQAGVFGQRSFLVAGLGSNESKRSTWTWWHVQVERLR